MGFVLTSLFVDSALQSTQHYQELLIHEDQTQQASLRRHLEEMFRLVDADDSGFITKRNWRLLSAAVTQMSVLEVLRSCELWELRTLTYIFSSIFWMPMGRETLVSTNSAQ